MISELWGIECDRLGKVYIPIRLQAQVQIFTADGTFLCAIGSFGFSSFPCSVAIDSQDLVYVSEHNRHCVDVLDNEGNSISKIGSFFGSFNSPRGIAVDECDVLYVCDHNNDQICIV